MAGKFEEKKALALVEKYLGSIPEAEPKLDDTYTEEPAQDGERSVMLCGVSAASVRSPWPITSRRRPTRITAALSLLGGIISQQPNGRLYKALVESKKATSANASAGNNHDPGLFTISAPADAAKIDDVRETLLKTIEGLSSEAVHQEEVNKAKVRSRRARRNAASKCRGDVASA